MSDEVKHSIVFVVGALLLAVVIVVGARSCQQINADYMKACIAAGNKPGECRQAVPQ